MKIVIVNRHPHDSLGGSEIQCDLIAEALTARGHEVEYFAAWGKPRAYDVAYTVRSIARPGFWAFLKAFRQFRPDVVYWRHGKLGLLGVALAAKLSGARFVHSLSHVADGLPWQSTYGHSFPALPWPPTPRSIARWGLKVTAPLRQAFNFMAIPLFTDMVISNNRDFLEGVPCLKRRVIHNSMRTEAVPFSWPKPFVVWVANIKSRKRPEDFFRLSAELRDIGVDFLMVGAVQDPAYTLRIDEWTKADNFHYLGAKTLTEVNGILAASQLLVHTCEPEGFPNNCIQAWLQGKPVVSLRFDPEGLLEQRGLGRYSRVFGQFCEDVRDLLRDEKLRLQYGERASAYAVREFSAHYNIGYLEHALEDVTGKPLFPAEQAPLGRNQ
jgi:glycosyltransferase involved in cell wall biosynthesis